MKVDKIIIIGGGVAGLSASIYAARAGLNPILISGFPYGGQLMLTSEVENYPGFESILGSELIDKMRKQTQKFGTKIIDDNVDHVDLKKSPFSLLTSKEKFLTKSIIISTGAKAIWLGLESEKKLIGKGVSACATCDGFFFKDKIVAVVGGGDSAMEEALTLTKFASRVYIIHRRGEFRASQIMQDRVKNNPKIEIILNSEVVEVLGKDKVEGIKIYNMKHVTSNIKVDGLFVAIGHKPDTEIFKDQIKLDSKGYIMTSAIKALEVGRLKSWKVEELSKFDFNYSTMTSKAGIFAAGDCVDYKYRQAGTAAGTGIQAALDVEKWLGNIA
jgi:thioredoxin reductase (NADPH)